MHGPLPDNVDEPEGHGKYCERVECKHGYILVLLKLDKDDPNIAHR